MLDRSPIKRRQYSGMFIAVDWDVKYKIKQVSSKFEQINILLIFLSEHFFRSGYRFGLCDKLRIYFMF